MTREGASFSGGASVLVSLGSNIEPRHNLTEAVILLAAEVSVRASSAVFESRAVARAPTPDFLNAAVEIRTGLSAAELKFGVLRELEWRLGRRRTSDRNAPRRIDLDIAIYGDEILESESPRLVVPDPEILTRPHVALPLADVAPDRLHPASGESLSVIAARLSAASQPGTIRPAAEGDFLKSLLETA